MGAQEGQPPVDAGAETALGGTLPLAPDDAPPTHDPLCNRTLHHFKVLSLLGRGGMGAVYRAHDLSLDRVVALKVIASSHRDTEARQRFVREARAQARLSHPSVVPIYYIGEEDELQFFAMELVEGESLDQPLLRGERLDPERALDLLAAVADALRQAQKRGLVHRDIKPSNLLVDEAGHVKVADFGLAKSVAEDVQLTQQGAVIGSPLYMSPEQGQGDAVDHRSDIYSLGATFYHLVVGAPPFSARTPLGVITKHITQPLPSVRSLVPSTPLALAGLLERMLQKDPSRRHQSYEELLEAIEAARPAGLRPAGFWVRSIATVVDLLPFLVLFAIVGPLAWLLYAGYSVAGWRRYGKTAGKWLFNIKVVGPDCTGPSVWRGLLRFACFGWGVWVLLLVFTIQHLIWGPLEPGNVRVSSRGELWQAYGLQISMISLYVLIWLAYLGSLVLTGFRRDRRSLHDLLAGTSVVYDMGTPPQPANRPAG